MTKRLSTTGLGATFSSQAISSQSLPVSPGFLDGIDRTQANGVHLDICTNLRLCIQFSLDEAVLVHRFHYQIVNCLFILLHLLLPLRQPIQLQID